MKSICINLFQNLTAKIIVAISGGSSETCFAYAVFLHGVDHFHLVILCSLVKFFKTFFQGIFYFFSEIVNFGRDSKLCIHFFHNNLFLLFYCSDRRIPFSLHTESM